MRTQVELCLISREWTDRGSLKDRSGECVLGAVTRTDEYPIDTVIPDSAGSMRADIRHGQARRGRGAHDEDPIARRGDDQRAVDGGQRSVAGIVEVEAQIVA